MRFIDSELYLSTIKKNTKVTKERLMGNGNNDEMKNLAVKSILVYIQSPWNRELDFGTKDAVITASWMLIISENVTTDKFTNEENADV